MELIALGSGGWIPSDTRHTACHLIDTGKSLLLLDAGSGLCRLSSYESLLKKYKEINIIFSHYHLDHTIGISYISNWCHNRKLNIYGPGKKLGFKSCREVLSELMTPPFFPKPIDTFAESVNIIDYDLEGFQVDDITIKILQQGHSGNSFGITIGDYMHYATDTVILEDTFKRAEGTELLLHDCWSVLPENSADHSSYEEINKMLDRYKIKKLGLIHINPNWKADKFVELKSKFRLEGQTFVMEDGMSIEV